MSKKEKRARKIKAAVKNRLRLMCQSDSLQAGSIVSCANNEQLEKWSSWYPLKDRVLDSQPRLPRDPVNKNKQHKQKRKQAHRDRQCNPAVFFRSAEDIRKSEALTDQPSVQPAVTV